MNAIKLMGLGIKKFVISVAWKFVAAGRAGEREHGTVSGDMNRGAGGGRADRGLGGVEGEGEGPKVVGMAGVVASGGDADAARGAEEALGFAEVVAEVGVDGDLDGAVFEGLEEFGGEVFGDADALGGSGGGE